MNIKHFFERKRFLGLVSVALVFALIFILGNKPTLYLIEEQKLQTSPDYFLENVHSKSYDVDGTLFEEVIANTANHYNDSQKTLLTKPNITRIQVDSNTVAIADTGTINDATRNFTLAGNASIERTDNAAKKVRIDAKTIIYDDAAQLIVGEENATLTSSQVKTSSSTLIYNLIYETMSLDGDVTSNYEPLKK